MQAGLSCDLTRILQKFSGRSIKIAKLRPTQQHLTHCLANPRMHSAQRRAVKSRFLAAPRR